MRASVSQACITSLYGMMLKQSTLPADEELRLVIAGYIRPEANFTSVEALIEQIHGDADVTRRMLKDGHIAQLAEHAVLWPERN